ncbi:hypothetical protein RA267_29905, partial [Pseudomonas syringae pv. tagetis]|uniref:hypothetical protein n=1 Tax=Pseudomonas syringae group genomosp. 7 TaxID=251699 RepID=UPI00376FF476
SFVFLQLLFCLGPPGFILRFKRDVDIVRGRHCQELQTNPIKQEVQRLPYKTMRQSQKKVSL